MGNHAVGQATGFASEEAVKSRSSNETALEILDRVCAPYRDCDAEFESINPDSSDPVHPDYDHVTHPHTKAALGMLMLEAFSPNGIADLEKYAPMLTGGQNQDEECDAWYD